jgi:hypothetical protein
MVYGIVFMSVIRFDASMSLHRIDLVFRSEIGWRLMWIAGCLSIIAKAGRTLFHESAGYDGWKAGEASLL